MKNLIEKRIFFKCKEIKLCGILRNPSKSFTQPVIILCHGFSSHKNSHSYTDIADILSKNDISSFRFDFYGHGESEGLFENITITEAVDNILQAIKLLKLRGYKKIGLLGGSFGGIASIIAASKSNDLYLLALKSPVSNYPQLFEQKEENKTLINWKNKGYKYYLSGNGKKLKLNYNFYIDGIKNNGYLASKKIKVPTIIVHGNKDESVPYKQSVETSKIIKKCILYIVEGANHHYDDQKNYKEMIYILTNFIIQN